MDFTTSTAPWFFVALLAGAFTILGGLISIGGSALVDFVKSKRERHRVLETEVLDASIEFMAAAGDVRKFAVDSTHTEAAEKGKARGVRSPPLLARLQDAHSRFLLASPRELIAPSDELLGQASLMLMPIFDDQGLRKLIRDLDQAVSDFRDAIRQYRGLDSLGLSKRDPGRDIKTAEMIHTYAKQIGKQDDEPK